MSECVFPGSFDPITCGHLDMIRRISSMYDTVIVAVMVNRAKEGCIPFQDRVRLIRKACGELPNVRAELWTGLLSDYLRFHRGSVVIRGVRSTQEFEQEKTAAAINRHLNPGMETLFLPASDGWTDLSSSAVREIASFGGDFRSLVPESIYGDLQEWLIKKNEK